MTARSLRCGFGFGPKTIKLARTFVNAQGVPVRLIKTGSTASTLAVSSRSVPAVGETVNLTYSPAGGFVPDSGFTVTPVSTFAHTNLVDIAKSSGNFGTHGDNNPSAYTWPSAGGTARRHLLLGALDFEDGSMTTNGWARAGFQYNIDGSAPDTLLTKWALSNTAPPANSTWCARRFHAGAEQGAINMLSPFDYPTLIADFKLKIDPSMQSGKFFRPYMDTGPADIYNSTGCYNLGWRASGENFPGGQWVVDPNTPTVLFNPGSWDHCEFYGDCGTNHFIGTLNGVIAAESNNALAWPTAYKAGHTVDIGHMVDNPDAGRCPDHPTWDASQYWGPVFLDTTLNSFWVANASSWAARTKWEMQVPITWGTNATTVRIALNRGEHTPSNFSGLYLYWRNASGTMTRIGRFP